MVMEFILIQMEGAIKDNGATENNTVKEYL
jgi:hypothetical protein